ncbi:MAG: hypothetical protein AABZ12_05950 [Planctomycetota bacterium]
MPFTPGPVHGGQTQGTVITGMGQLLASTASDEIRFVTELRRAPKGWAAVAAVAIFIAALWAVAWMYRREGRVGASSAARLVMAVLRCLILTLLAAILLDPVRVRILRRWIDSYTVVLADTSSSMDLSDNYRDETARESVKAALGDANSPTIRRTDLMRHLLASQDRGLLKGLADRNRIRLFSFGDEPVLVGTARASREAVESPRSGGPGGGMDQNEPPSAPPSDLLGVDQLPLNLPANGSTTNIERAFRRAVESAAGAPIAGMIVFSDGGFNQGASAEDVARFAAERGIAIHAVGIGDPSPPRNVRVSELSAPENVFQQDPFSINARFANEGIDGERLRVVLQERSLADGGERLVDARIVVVPPGGGVEPVSFELRQERPGRYLYRVSVDAVEDESITEDNRKDIAVRVIDAKLRVLLIAGAPNWDYRFVTVLLQRDATVDLSCWLQSADVNAVRDGDVVIDHLPLTAEELFGYDVIMLMDPDQGDLDEDWCRLVDKFVSQYGGGLLYVAARPHTPGLLRDPAFKPLVDLLPVSTDPEADLVLNQIGHYQVSPRPIEIPPSACAHPILRLSDDPVATKLAWQGVGDVYWHYPVLREKPVATVLMRHGDPRMRNAYGGHVLAATQFVGAGRTAFLGFDSSWRWRRVDENYYNRFWIQLVRYLSEGKLLGGSRRVMLAVDNERPALGEAVTVSARLLDARYEPVNVPSVNVQFEIEDRRGELALAANPDRPGWYEGRFVPDATGSFRLSVQASAIVPGETDRAERELIVSRPNLEIARPQMSRSALQALADGSAGGRYWRVDEAAAIPETIPDSHEEILIRSRPTTLWDNGSVLTLLVLLMSAEWAMRKWNRLL